MAWNTAQGDHLIEARVVGRRVINRARPANYAPPVIFVMPAVPATARGGTARKLLRVTWAVIRTALFFTLHVVRPLVLIPLRIVGGLCVIVSLVMFGLSWCSGWQMSMLETAGGSLLAAIGLSAMGWYYDVLLLKLAPQSV